uniref:DDE_3 domain-containing protein n=1 Tax=Heterorhabditis bacteriophora TaxID=37862 RepID=A0A1I7WC43_HETBA
MKGNRYEKARKLLNIVRQGSASNVLFTDENIFTVNSTYNSHNSKKLLRRSHQRSEKASVSSRNHFPSSVMIWAGKTASELTFQKDWASAHGAKTTVEPRRQQFPDLRQGYLVISHLI